MKPVLPNKNVCMLRQISGLVEQQELRDCAQQKSDHDAGEQETRGSAVRRARD